jgi:hypothetical protein
MVPRSTLFNELNYPFFTSQCVRLADFTTELGSVVKPKQTNSSECLVEGAKEGEHQTNM